MACIHGALHRIVVVSAQVITSGGDAGNITVEAAQKFEAQIVSGYDIVCWVRGGVSFNVMPTSPSLVFIGSGGDLEVFGMEGVRICLCSAVMRVSYQTL